MKNNASMGSKCVCVCWIPEQLSSSIENYLRLKFEAKHFECLNFLKRDWDKNSLLIDWLYQSQSSKIFE